MAGLNDTLWREYDRLDCARGRLVASLLSRRLELNASRIVDVGSGTGGVSLVLAGAGARVKAIEPDAARLKKLISRRGGGAIEWTHAPAEQWHEDGARYDAAVLLDALEHVRNPLAVLRKIRAVLKNEGLLYLSTPNRTSIFNLACDPHFSLPLIAAWRRQRIKTLLSGILKWQNPGRTDYPQLLGLAELSSLLRRARFSWQFINREAVAYALTDPGSIWNRPWHRKFIRVLKHLHLEPKIVRILSDRPGLFNRWLNATWFILARPVKES